MKTIIINTEFITLGQFLKMTSIISSGGEAKHYLLENNVLINDIEESRRGRKIYSNDIVEVENIKYIVKND